MLLDARVPFLAAADQKLAINNRIVQAGLTPEKSRETPKAPTPYTLSSKTHKAEISKSLKPDTRKPQNPMKVNPKP